MLRALHDGPHQQVLLLVTNIYLDYAKVDATSLMERLRALG